MIIGGTFSILNDKWRTQLSFVVAPARASAITEGRLGGKTGKVGSNVAVKPPPKGGKDQFPDWLLWAGKQHIGIRNYWILNKWGRWEDYTMKDAAADWAMDKAIRLTVKGGKSVVNRVTTTKPPATYAVPSAVGGSWLAAAGLSWMFGGGIILNALQVVGTPNWSLDSGGEEFAAL